VKRPDRIDTCYVCVNLSCSEGGSRQVLDALQERLSGSSVEVKEYICFGACWMGPNIVLYPQGTWYSDVQTGDVEEIATHIEGGPRVERLAKGGVDPGLYDLIISILDAGLG
jgi:(2Fe-2S) ferredoxin